MARGVGRVSQSRLKSPVARAAAKLSAYRAKRPMGLKHKTGFSGPKSLRTHQPLGWGIKGSVKRQELALYARNIRKVIGVHGVNRWGTSRGAAGAIWIRGQWEYQRTKMARSSNKRMLAQAHRSLTQRTARQRAQSRINGAKNRGKG